MPTHVAADPDAAAIVGELLADVYALDLGAHKVTVTTLFALAPRDDNGEPKPPALKVGGLAVPVVARVTSQRDRVAGLADALVIVDGDEWQTWGDDYRRAVLDHGLQSLELVIDPDSDQGAPVLDDCNRPKLRKRRADFAVSGYAAVVSRHGEHAPEVVALAAANATAAQWQGVTG